MPWSEAVLYFILIVIVNDNVIVKNFKNLQKLSKAFKKYLMYKL